MLKRIAKIESYGFECIAGPLELCVDWLELKDDVKNLLVEVERLREDIEQLRVQLAACGVAAMCNTAQSRGQQKCAEGDYGWSQSSYQDAVNAVGREIALRDQLQDAQALAARHLADQDYLCAKERKRVVSKCIELAKSVAINYHGTTEETPVDSYTVHKIIWEIEMHFKERK